MSWQTLALDLLHRGAALVLGFTNVGEFTPKGTDLQHVENLADQLEQLPHTFIRQPSIRAKEFKEAFAAHHDKRAVRPIDPYVPKFWRAFWKPVLGTVDLIVHPMADELDRMPISQQLRILLQNPESLMFDEADAQKLQKVLDDDRARLGTSRGSFKSFRVGVISQLQQARLPEPVGGIDAFAEWIYKNPTICPGWRLGHDVYEEFRSDLQSPAKKGHIPDFSHFAVIPYVEKATLDRTWRTYAQRAADRLARAGLNTTYISRIYPDLAEIRKAWVSSP